MALFKPFEGTSEELEQVASLHPGYVYATTDDGLLHYDTGEKRITINAKNLVDEDGNIISADEVLTTNDVEDLEDVVIIEYGDTSVTLTQIDQWIN